MTDQQHKDSVADAKRCFIIFERSNGHCATFLVHASALRDAMAIYYVRHMLGETWDGGPIQTDDGYGGAIVYGHPLECIESEIKSGDGLDGASWEVRKLREVHLTAPMAEIFCSADPREVENYIKLCRSLFRESFPGSRARAFVWYLKDGPLVTFHRRKNPKRRWPAEVMARYLLPWSEWPVAKAWNGSLNDILDQMKLEYPTPVAVDSVDVKRKIERALQQLLGEPLSDM